VSGERKLRGSWQPIMIGPFIRDYLLEHGEAYPYEIYKALQAEKEKPKGSYQNIRNYFFWLQELGLIRFVREEPSRNPKFKPKRYYALVKEKIDDLAWRNPRRHLYRDSYEKWHKKKIDKNM